MEKSRFFELKGLTIFEEGPICRKKTPGYEIPPTDAEKRFLIEITKTNLLRLEMKIYSFHLTTGQPLRFLKLVGEDDNVILDVQVHYQNRLVIVQGDKEILITKNHLYLDDWNLVSILINFEKNTASIYLNGELSESSKYEKSLTPGLHILWLGIKDESNSFKGLMKNCLIDSSDDASSEFKEKQTSRQLYAEPRNMPLGSPKELHLWAPNEMVDRYQIVRTPLQNTYRRKKGKPKLLICNDFANGYVNDRHVFGYDTTSFTYKFYHWNHLDIYIHFTHCFIGLPPPSITNMAHSYGTKCLGVICTEWELGEKYNKILLSGSAEDEDGEVRFKGKYYYADKLTSLCKHYGFDGYLLNIEAKVENAKELAEWVAYFTKKMKEEVPGSIIMWYDSIVSSGEVKWQSMVNEHNRAFFDASDYFFTDYHWAEEKLSKSAQNANQEIEKLFTGIDCCGRGAYKGGQFNSYMGVNKCIEVNSSIALFAQGWTAMENYGGHSRELFLRNDEKLWMGRDYQVLASREGSLNQPKKDWQEDLVGGQGWAYAKVEEGSNEMMSTTSHDYCLRSLTIDLVNLKVDLSGENPGVLTFDFQVRGNGPKVNDPWICTLEGMDSSGNVILFKDSYFNKVQYQKNNSIDPRFNKNMQSMMNAATGEWVQHKIEIDLKEIHMNTRKNIKFIRISEAGKDLEYWAGHFGPSFKGEIVSISKGYDPSKSILKMIGTRRNIALPIHTYFNEGHGKAMFIEGLKQGRPGKSYNSVADLDLNYGYYGSGKRYKFFDTEDKNLGTFRLIDNDPWTGGSSLCLSGNITANSVQTYKLYKTDLEVSSLTILICAKNLHSDLIITPFTVDKNKDLKKFKQEKGVKKNNWMIYRYDLTYDAPANVRGIFFYLENTSQNQVTYQINFGELSIYEGKTWNERIKDVELKKTNELFRNVDARMAAEDYIFKDKFKLNKHYYLQFNLDIPQDHHLLVKYYQVFRNDVWYLNSRTPYIYLHNLPIENDKSYDEFKVQLVLLNGRKQKLSDIEPYIVMYDEIRKI